MGNKVRMEKCTCLSQNEAIVKVLHENTLDAEKDEGKKMDAITENMALSVYENSNDVRDVSNDGFDSKEEKERLFEEYGIENNASKEYRLAR